MSMKERKPMTCEEFELAGLDLNRPDGDAELQAAREHLRSCGRCAQLQASWEALREELKELAQETQAVTSGRVEMRLRQEFGNVHRPAKTQRRVTVAALALAAAAVLALTLAWVRWNGPKQSTPAPIAQNAPMKGGNSNGISGESIVASNDSGDFVVLPGTLAGTFDTAQVVRVRMQRGSLSAWGLNVNEADANDWIQVDVLLGDDGQPQAVRLPATVN